MKEELIKTNKLLDLLIQLVIKDMGYKHEYFNTDFWYKELTKIMPVEDSDDE